MQTLRLQHVAWVRKRGSIRETFKVSVSSVFPKCFLVCDPIRQMLKTQNLRHDGKKCFRNFSKTFFASWTQFCFCNNVSLFALALMPVIAIVTFSSFYRRKVESQHAIEMSFLQSLKMFTPWHKTSAKIFV